MEILVVVAILVMLVGAGVSSFDRFSGVKLGRETNRLAAAIRYTFNRSTALGLYMRMVFDLDTETFWVEASEEPQFLAARKLKEGEDATEVQAAAEAERLERLDLDEDEKAKRTPRARFQDDPVVPRTQLEGGAQIAGVRTSSQDDEFRTGKAYLYFFPSGWVEPALIYTSDGAEQFYTLQISPLTGKVHRSSGRVDAPRDFGEPEKVEAESR